MMENLDRPSRIANSGFLLSAALVSLLFLLPGTSSLMLAQSAAASGSISGAVTDPQGKLIPGAQVTIRNADFLAERTLVTDEAGHFSALFLPAGNYSIAVKAQGFVLKKPPRIPVGVGTSVQVTVRLAVAAASEQVTVTGQAAMVEGNTVPPAVNKQEVAVGNTVAGLTVTYLPNRDRDFSQFAQFAAGVDSDQDSGGLVVAGQRPTGAQAAVDGANFYDPLLGGLRGLGDHALFFPQTAVREFEIVHAGAGAEVGGTNAGFLNVATKSGANKFRGEAFYIGRPAGLTSKDAFGNSLDNVQNEFGGSVGGPIRKNQAFFYFAAEQDFLSVPYWSQFQPQAPGTGSVLIAAPVGQIVSKSHPTALFGRVDLLLNSVNTLNLESNYNHVHTTNIGDGSTRSLATRDNSGLLRGDSIWMRANLTSTFGSTRVNQLLGQWSNDHRSFSPNSTAPESVINGFGVLGGNSLDPHDYSSGVRQISDDLAISGRSHVLRIGSQFAYDPAREQHEANLNGRFDYNSLTDFLAGRTRRYQQTFATGDPTYSGAVRYIGLYATDKWTLHPNLTVTAGLCWEGQWNPQPKSPNPGISQTSHIPDDLALWQPRLGVAWNAMTNTVIRISAGLYDASTPATTFQRVFTDNGVNTVVADSYFDPGILPLVSSRRAFSSLPAGLTVPAALVVGIAPNFRNPRSFQAAGSVEQQLNAKVSVSAGYVRNSTWDLPRAINTNLNPPAVDSTGLPVFPGTRPNPAIGQLLLIQSNAHSGYDGLLLTANLQLPHRSQLMANYTLARTRDDDTTIDPFRPPSVLNPFNLAAERGYSSLDVRNNFNLSAVTNLPLGFKFNPVVVTRSGFPYTPIVGFDLQRDSNDFNDRAILGGKVAERNSLRQPSFFNLDVRFVKDFTLPGEGHHLDLFIDIFNVTGASNRYFPDGVSLFGTAASPVFTAGQPLYAPDTTRFGSARQVQFTARLVAF